MAFSRRLETALEINCLSQTATHASGVLSLIVTPFSSACTRKLSTTSLTISEISVVAKSAAPEAVSRSSLARESMPWANPFRRSASPFSMERSLSRDSGGNPSGEARRSTAPIMPVSGVLISCDTSAMKSLRNASTFCISSTRRRCASRSRASSRILARCLKVKSSTDSTPVPPTIAARRNPIRARRYGASTRDTGSPSRTRNSPHGCVTKMLSSCGVPFPTESNTIPPGALRTVNLTPFAEQSAPNSCIRLKSPVSTDSFRVEDASSVRDSRSRRAQENTASRKECVSDTKTATAPKSPRATNKDGRMSNVGSFTASPCIPRHGQFRYGRPSVQVSCAGWRSVHRRSALW